MIHANWFEEILYVNASGLSWDESKSKKDNEKMD